MHQGHVASLPPFRTDERAPPCPTKTSADAAQPPPPKGPTRTPRPSRSACHAPPSPATSSPPSPSGPSRSRPTWSPPAAARIHNSDTVWNHQGKALANDQLLRWRCTETTGLPPTLIQQITGATPMRQREEMLAQASICLMTPGIAHAWLIRTASIPVQREFLRKLRLIITDEAHVYEDVLGSNAAFMFRRLASAAQAANNPDPVQIGAATATSRTPSSTSKTSPAEPSSRSTTRTTERPVTPPSSTMYPPPTRTKT